MVINTTHFGEVEIQDSSVLHFEEGIPGFEDIKKFTVLCDPENTTFKWLQAVDQPHPAFAVLSPFEVKSDYEVNIDDATKETLSINDQNEVVVCSIATITDDVAKMTTNLKAPIIINTSNNKARQMIMSDTSYTTKHLILDEMLASSNSKSDVSSQI